MIEAMCYIVHSTCNDEAEYQHVLKVPICPFCSFPHTHGTRSWGGNLKRVSLGCRVAHCSLSPERQIYKGTEYKLVLMDEPPKDSKA